jgi:hypothetical protein
MILSQYSIFHLSRLISHYSFSMSRLILRLNIVNARINNLIISLKLLFFNNLSFMLHICICKLNFSSTEFFNIAILDRFTLASSICLSSLISLNVHIISLLISIVHIIILIVIIKLLLNISLTILIG